MNYETYDEDKHTLEVGLPIRLAGREGEILYIETNEHKWAHNVMWTDAPDEDNFHVDLDKFPNLEVMVKPLTIDKRVKEWFIAECEHMEYYYSKHNILSYLNSLEEV